MHAILSASSKAERWRPIAANLPLASARRGFGRGWVSAAVLLAFFGISAFAVLGAAAALYSFREIESLSA